MSIIVKLNKQMIQIIRLGLTNLKELHARIVPDLDKCTNWDKKDAYTYLDLKVSAINEDIDIKGYVEPSSIKSQLRLLITGQTLG
jgi:site-specific DNA recombinase